MTRRWRQGVQLAGIVGAVAWLVSGNVALAANACGTHTGVLPSLYDGMPCDANGNITLNSVSAVIVIAGNVLRIMIALSGGLAVIFLVVGGVYYVVSMGDPGRIKQAKDTITHAITGLIIELVTYALETFIASKF